MGGSSVLVQGLQAGFATFQNRDNAWKARRCYLLLVMDFAEFELYTHSLGYVIQRPVGRGGMAEVFQAKDVRTGQTVALKRLHAPDERLRARFVREARLLQRLHHEHLVHGLAMFEAEPTFLVMNLVDAPSVAQRAGQGDFLSEADAWIILRQMASALVYLHSESVIHRDLKPANVLFSREARKAWLCDLGIAKEVDATRLTATNEAVGTLLFLAPEVFTGQEAGEPLDLYGLGATLYAGLAGRPPFLAASSDPYALIRKIVKEQTPDIRRLRPEISRQLQEVLDALLAKDPANRPLPSELLASRA